jgi:hypothetical protein
MLAGISLLQREMSMMKSMGDIIKVGTNREMRTSLRRGICFGVRVFMSFTERERLIKDLLEVIANY